MCLKQKGMIIGMNVVKKVGDIVNRIGEYMKVIPFVGFLLIVSVTVVDIVLRYVFNSPILGSYEVIQYILLVSAFLSFGYCQTLKGHISVTSLVRVFPPMVKTIIYALTSIIGFLMCVVFAYAIAKQAVYLRELGYISEVLRFSTWPIIWVVFFGLVIFAVTLFWEMIRSFVAIADREFAAELQKDWE